MQLEKVKKVVIHLKDSDRSLKHLQEKFTDVQIFPAVLNPDTHKGISDSFKGVVLRSLTEECVLIFEDDVFFQSEKSIEVFQKCIDSLPDDWDILLGGIYWTDGKDPFNEYLDKVEDFCALHCVLVRKKAYQHFISHNSYEIKNIDRHLGKLSKEGKLNAYVCNPMIAIQSPGFSYHVGKAVDYSNRLKEFNIL